MSTDFKCNDGNEHDFDSNTESDYCAKGCGEKWAIYAIKKLGADLKEKDAAVEQLKAENSDLKYKKEYLISGYETMLNEANAEIAALKSKLKIAKETLQLIADDASKPIEQISGYFIGEETLDQVEYALKKIGGEM